MTQILILTNGQDIIRGMYLPLKAMVSRVYLISCLLESMEATHYGLL
jgi:hypothetical protein